MKKTTLTKLCFALSLYAGSILAAPVAEFVPSSVVPSKAACSLRKGDNGIRVNGTVLFEPSEQLESIQSISHCQVVKFSEQYVFLVAVYRTRGEAGTDPQEQAILELAVLNKEFNRYHSVFNMPMEPSDRDACQDVSANLPALRWGYSSVNTTTPVVEIPNCGEQGMSYYYYDPVTGFQPF
jgi:hypothetical protein